MPNNTCVPLFPDPKDISVRATAAVVGKTFADISANIQSGPAITTAALDAAYDGGNVQAATCGVGVKPIGVFAYDRAEGELVPLKCVPGSVVPVTAGAAITAGQEVQSGAGGKAVPLTPAAAIAATLQTGVVGSNTAITYTAKDAGYAGDGISVRLKDPAANSQALAVTVTGNDIVVSLATNSGGAITSTAAQIIAALAASEAASSLIGAANTGASTGAGVVAAVAATNLAGGADAANGKAAGKAFTSAEVATDCYVRLYI